jgi:hypothetical protein
MVRVVPREANFSGTEGREIMPAVVRSLDASPRGGADQVVTWRRDQLIHSGLRRSLATRLAQDPRYDLHALIDLLERGSPPELAIRILAPLEGEHTP